jgi:hypothetical protein
LLHGGPWSGYSTCSTAKIVLERRFVNFSKSVQSARRTPEEIKYASDEKMLNQQETRIVPVTHLLFTQNGETYSFSKRINKPISQLGLLSRHHAWPQQDCFTVCIQIGDTLRL